jgi:hypothetical protein
MKVRIINSAVGPAGVYKKGEIRELPEKDALQLVKDKIAEVIAEKPEETREKADGTATKRNKR